MPEPGNVRSFPAPTPIRRGPPPIPRDARRRQPAFTIPTKSGDPIITSVPPEEILKNHRLYHPESRWSRAKSAAKLIVGALIILAVGVLNYITISLRSPITWQNFLHCYWIALNELIRPVACAAGYQWIKPWLQFKKIW